MNFNPLIGTCAEIQNQIDVLQQNVKQVADELQWFNSIDPRALTEDLQRSEAEVNKLQLEIQELEKEFQENKHKLGEIAPAIRTLLNPFNWFAKDQIDLRRRRSQLREIDRQKIAQRQSMLKKLQDIRTRMAKLESDLQRHSTFDLPQRQSTLSKIKQSITGKKEEMEVVAERKRRVDQVLAPIIQEMQNLESRKHFAELDLDAAQDFEQRLSVAKNTYERAMIHEQCEHKFSDGSPRKIVGQREREIRQVDRDYDKARRRAEEIGHMVARKIEMLVIDGNNLCYEGGTFIGLAAIATLVPLLSRGHSVIVVFDSAIRRLLSTDDYGIQQRLGNYAKVHIVASERLADETLLDLASTSAFTYVLSNDRFGDFNEKAVVKAGRIIRHEVVNGNIFVHDLQVRAAYR